MGRRLAQSSPSRSFGSRGERDSLERTCDAEAETAAQLCPGRGSPPRRLALTRKRTSSKPLRSSLLSYCCRPSAASHAPTLCSSAREPAERGIGRRLKREKPLRQQRHSEEDRWHCHIIVITIKQPNYRQETRAEDPQQRLVLCGRGWPARRRAHPQPRARAAHPSASAPRREANPQGLQGNSSSAFTLRQFTEPVPRAPVGLGAPVIHASEPRGLWHGESCDLAAHGSGEHTRLHAAPGTQHMHPKQQRTRQWGEAFTCFPPTVPEQANHGPLCQRLRQRGAARGVRARARRPGSGCSAGTATSHSAGGAASGPGARSTLDPGRCGASPGPGRCLKGRLPGLDGFAGLDACFPRIVLFL